MERIPCGRALPALALTLMAFGVCGAPAAAEPQFAFEFGGASTPPPGQLSAGGVAAPAVDRDGNVWVADAPAGRVVKYDYNGSFIAAFGSAQGGGGNFGSPIDVAADAAGNVYVLDQGGPNPQRLVQMTVRGRFIRTIGAGGPAGLSGPNGVAVDDRSFVYISEGGPSRIRVFNAAGAEQPSINLPFNGGRLAIGRRREIYVSQGGGGTVRRLSNAGALRSTVTVPGGVRGVGYNRFSGRVYIAHAGNPVVAEYTRSLIYLRDLTLAGTNPGQTIAPEKIATDCRGSLYITSFGGGAAGPAGPTKVIKFVEPGAPPPPCTPAGPLTEPVDGQINDIEVTQGVHGRGLFTGVDAPAGPRTRGWADPSTDVPLRTGGKTVVRVYASLRSGDAGGVGNVPATLEGVSSAGRRFGPISPDAGPAVLRVGDATVDMAERTDPAGAYTFTLPEEWTRVPELELTARINPAGLGCDDACQRRSTFRLTGVKFQETTRGCSISAGGGRPRPACDPVYGVDVWAVALTNNGAYPRLGAQTLTEPGPAFSAVSTTTPVNLVLGGWRAEIDIGRGDQAWENVSQVKTESCFLGIQLGITCSEEVENIDLGPAQRARSREIVQGGVMGLIQQFKEERNIGDATVLIGVRGRAGVRNDPLLPGAMRGKFLEGRGGGPVPAGGARGYVDVNSPLGSVVHELQHALGREHAGQNRACYPDEDQLGEPWPDATNSGQFFGIGMDTRAASGGFRGPYRIIASPAAPATPMSDLMSYCNNTEGNLWISTIGWNKVLDYKKPLRVAPARTTQAPGPLLRVTAVEFDNGGLRIAETHPTQGRALAADPSARYQLEARDAGGGILSAVPMQVETLDVGGTLLTGAVPRPAGTAQVVVRRATEAATRRRRSANAPRLRLIAPRPGARVAGRGMTVRWNATDRDNDPLTATVELSVNAGRSWRALHVGASRGSRTLPMALLGGSRNARVRVRVHDGFDEASATSGRITVTGPRPLVRLLEPVRRQRIRADAPLRLSARAVGDFGAPLGYNAIRWFDGRRALGLGPAVAVQGLRPGRHRLRAVARVGGRSGSASVLVRVLAVRPAFLRLDLPNTVSRRARRVRLRVATTVATRLQIGRQRFAVGRSPRRVAVAVRPGSTPLRLTLRLGSGRLTTSRALTLPRG
jgi:hypothetical protein